MQIKIRKIHPYATMPTYATKGSGCFDLSAVIGMYGGGSAVMNVGTATVFDTGLAFEIPEDHVMLVFSRSGHGFNKNVRLSNCVGVVDADYRGEVKVKLTRDEHDGGDMVVRSGDRIAQALVVPAKKVEFVWADELSETERGAGGLGSSGS